MGTHITETMSKIIKFTNKWCSLSTPRCTKNCQNRCVQGGSRNNVIMLRLPPWSATQDPARTPFSNIFQAGKEAPLDQVSDSKSGPEGGPEAALEHPKMCLGHARQAIQIKEPSSAARIASRASQKLDFQGPNGRQATNSPPKK